MIKAGNRGMLIDTHAHLEMLEDIPQVIERAKDTGLERIVAVSSDLISSRKTVGIAEDYPIVFAAVGVHPHEASSVDDEVLSQLEDLGNVQKVISIGETGLDY